MYKLVSVETKKSMERKGIIYYDCLFDKFFQLNGIPPQAWLQAYLRDNYDIETIQKPFYDSLHSKKSYVCDAIRMKDGRVIMSPRMDSFEEALERGLQNGLTLVDDD